MNQVDTPARNSKHSGAMTAGAAKQASNSVTPQHLPNEAIRGSGNKFNDVQHSRPRKERHYQPTQAPAIKASSGPKF